MSISPLRFGSYRLDSGSGRLWRNEEPLHLTPKAFALLRFLAERPGELVSKEALFEAVWPNTVVGDDALSRCIHEVRSALGDDPRRPTFLETVHRRGFRFLAPAAEGAPKPPPARAFVGRESALERGRAVLAEAMAGRAQILFVCGEPGVGKTRLAEELSEIARAGGALPLWGRAHEGEGRPPYWIWTQVLRRHAELQGGGDLSGLLQGGSGPSAGQAGLEPAAARFPIFDAVTRFFARAAATQPLFVVLDDLHAADPDSLRLLCFVAQELGSARVVLLCTYRDVGSAPNPALGEALGLLVPARDGRGLIELRGLPREDVRRLLALLVNTEIAERFADALHDKTGGNPLYLYELVRLLREEGTADAPATLRVATPETVRQVLRRRLDGLSAACREALTLAAVAGAEFSPRLLEHASESGEAPFADGIHEAEAERLVQRDERDAARFAHGLLREILYDGLRPGVRARLHRRIAHALESAAASRPEPPLAALAHHFGRAVLGGDVDKAIHYARRAGGRALAALAFEEAASHFESVMELLESLSPLDARAQCEAELAAARAHFACGRTARARELAWQALERARGMDSAELLCEASATFCELEPSYGRHPAELQILDDALARLGAESLAPRARLLALRGMLSFLEPDPEGHLRFGREAVELARRSGDRRVLLDSLRCLCFALRQPEREREWRDAYEEMIRVAHDDKSAALEFDGRLFRLEHRMQVGPPEAIELELGELDALAERLRTPGARSALLRARAGQALARGELRDARCLAESALAVGRAVDAPLAQAVSLLQLSTLQHMQCRLDEALPEVRSGADLNPAISLFQAGVIWALCETGARDEARRRLQALIDTGFASLPRDATFPIALSNLVLSYGRLGVTAGAERLLELLRPYAGRTLTLLYYFPAGCPSRQLGVLAGLLGRWDESAAHFETALCVDRAMGARAWEAFALVEYARMLRAQAIPVARARAGRLLVQARDLARSIGMPAIEREIAELPA